jgi:hypothetical protein
MVMGLVMMVVFIMVLKMEVFFMALKIVLLVM